MTVWTEPEQAEPACPKCGSASKYVDQAYSSRKTKEGRPIVLKDRYEYACANCAYRHTQNFNDLVVEQQEWDRRREKWERWATQ